MNPSPDVAETDLTIELNGVTTTVRDEGASLLDALRELGVASVKDGCSPQGQCGCCTVLVDGQARVSCVTPVRRVAGREVVTTEGLAVDTATRWSTAFVANGASQCGFCTPGIVLRLEALRLKDPERLRDPAAVHRALAAHLCRCTGWNTIVDAAQAMADTGSSSTEVSIRPSRGASGRATLESGGHQRVGPDVVLGHAPADDGGFAADTAPPDALVALVGEDGDWVVGETLAEARRLAARVQGRRTTVEARPPLDLPEGVWDVTLRTSWVEPAYLETDASWCAPGGAPSSPLANGGAFGAKEASPLPDVARRLADDHGRPVLALWSREDSVRRGPKRPPTAWGVNRDGSGVVRAVRTPGIEAAIRSVLPGVVVDEVDVAGPPTSIRLRAAGWAEAITVAAAAGVESDIVAVTDGTVMVRGAEGGSVSAVVCEGSIHLEVDAGDPLDEVMLRSYCVGAAHMALSWVTSESISVGPDGAAGDLTIRSFDVLRAADMVPVQVTITPSSGPPVAVSNHVFAAVAAAVWRDRGLPSDWPIGSAGA